MSGCLTFSQLVACIKQRILVGNFLNSATSSPAIVSVEAQKALIPIFREIEPVNAYYVKLFTKRFIQLIEELQEEVSEELYEYYCSGTILNATKNEATKSDIIEYFFTHGGGDGAAASSRCKSVKIRETPNIISGNGTTGHRTWEAAVFLSEYLNSGVVDLRQKTVCELGAGTGLIGLSLLMHYHWEIGPLNQILFTDGDSAVVEGIRKTLLLNRLDPLLPLVGLQQLVWGTTNKQDANYVQPAPSVDCIVAADVTYDSSILPSLCSTIQDFFANGTQIALIAATVRNEDTIASWHQELTFWFPQKWSIVNQCTEPATINSLNWFSMNTPEIRIYHIWP